MTVTATQQENFLKIRALLISLGLPEIVATFGAAQVFHETGGLKSRVSAEDNNFSGIVYINKPHQKNATKGRARPRSEGGYYAKYPTALDWARDYKRIIDRGAYPPSEAKQLGDFVQRLKDNKYYTDSVENYYNGVKRWMIALGKSIPANAPMAVEADGSITNNKPAYNVDNPDDKANNLLNRLFDPRFEGERVLSKKAQENLLLGGIALVSVMVVLNLTRR